jgi:hypothetical protein
MLQEPHVTVAQQIELTPIETAIELIHRKTISLKAELSTATPNIKTLQMTLQGSLLMRKYFAFFYVNLN